MELSREQKDAIRAEEHYRAEVRREISSSRPVGTMERVSAFFETKVGFWILTTALAGTAATGYSALQRFLDRERIAQQEIADRARRDTDMMIRLSPMLASEKPEQVRFAAVLLDGLTAGEAVDPELARRVGALFVEILRAGSAAGASPAQQGRAEAIVALVEAPISATAPPLVSTAQQPLAGTALADVAARSLPIRVYIQIAEDATRLRAEEMRAAYRAAGILAPGIERVAARTAPTARTQIRYCADKIGKSELEQVGALTASVLKEEPQMLELSDNLCARVRQNHLELWFAQSAR
ncbi:MAG: hypothetical protein ACK59M_14910 [Pseudomonadota bacterium]|jgi:hypothetical protein